MARLVADAHELDLRTAPGRPQRAAGVSLQSVEGPHSAVRYCRPLLCI
jgi:hypothetical protein